MHLFRYHLTFNARLFAFAALILIILGATEISQGKEQPDWWQTVGKGLDVGVSHTDKRWLIGEDGASYLWNSITEQWVLYGNRRDFKRIDGADNGGAAALTKSGRLFVTNGHGRWVSSGIRAEDVGIGGGQIWLSGASMNNGSKTVLRAPFTPNTELRWENIQGQVSRIDVDGAGRGWALDENGQLFVHTGEHWVEVTDAPVGADIGAAKNGDVFLVSSNIDRSLGGGELYHREFNSGLWHKVNGRFINVSASGDGKPFGVDSQNSFMIAGATTEKLLPRTGGELPTPGEQEPNNPSVENPTSLSLQQLAGGAAYIPEAIAEAIVDNLSGSESLTTGETDLNGLRTKVAIYTPKDADAPNIVLAFEQFRFRDFAPDFSGTALDDLDRFDNTILVLVPEANANSLPDDETAELLEKFTLRSELESEELATGINFIGTSDLTNLDDGEAISDLLVIENSELILSQQLKETLFANVSPSTEPASPLVPENQRTLEDIATHYGSDFFDNLTIGAEINTGEGINYGPFVIQEAFWSLSLGSNTGIRVTADIDLPISGGTTLQAEDTLLTFDKETNAFELTGGLTREKAQTIIDIKGVTLKSADFAGTYVIPSKGDTSETEEESEESTGDSESEEVAEASTENAESEEPPETSLMITGLSSFSSQSKSDVEVSYEIGMTLNEDENSFDYSLLLSGGLTLADITGTAIPIIENVELTQIEYNDELLAGSLTMDGRQVRVARYTGDKVQKPLIMFLHEDVNLASYIPHINETVLGSFSLGTTALFSTEGAGDDEVTVFNSKDELPEIAAEFFDTNQPGLFPIELKKGISLIGFYDPNQVSEEEAAPFDDLDIPKDSYVAKGHFDVAIINNMELEAVQDEASEVAATNKSESPESRRLDFDLQLNIGSFSVPGTEKYLTFNGAVFNLSREDKTIETSIATGIELSLKEDSGINLGGVRTLAMAGKLALEKSSDDDSDALAIKLASSTALNIDQATAQSFTNLLRFDDNDESSPEEEEATEEEASEPEVAGDEGSAAEK